MNKYVPNLKKEKTIIKKRVCNIMDDYDPEEDKCYDYFISDDVLIELIKLRISDRKRFIKLSSCERPNSNHKKIAREEIKDLRVILKILQK